MTYKAWLFAIVFVVLGAHAASAQGIEVFSATLTGTESCGNFNVQKIKQPIFVAFDSSEFVFALDINFNNIVADATIFAIYDASSTSIVFGAFEDDTEIIGVATGIANYRETSSPAFPARLTRST
jgi:hypothetical protein